MNKMIQFKNIFAVIFIYSWLTLFAPAITHAQQSCESLFSVLGKSHGQERVDALFEHFKALGIQVRVIELESHHSGPVFGKFDGNFQIEASKNGERVGSIIIAGMNYLESRVPIYETHISVKTSARGQGVGSALYLMAGRFVQRKGGFLISTSDPSKDAKNVWERFVSYDMARQIPDFTSLPGTQSNPMVFTFRTSVLNSKEATQFDSLMQGLDDALQAVPYSTPDTVRFVEVPNGE